MGFPDEVSRNPFTPTATPFCPTALTEANITLCPVLDKGVVGNATKFDGRIWLALLTVIKAQAVRITAIRMTKTAIAFLMFGRLLRSASSLLIIAVHLGGFENRFANALVIVKVFPARSAVGKFRLFVADTNLSITGRMHWRSLQTCLKRRFLF